MASLPRFVRRMIDRVTGRKSAAPRAERGATGKPAAVRGRYDAASTSDQNRNHWAAADGLSANAAHSPAVRQILRNRSRYEAQNNGYCKGLLRTRRNDVVGTGPRLQVSLPDEFKYIDPDFLTDMTAVVPEGTASAVERKWVEWCDRIGLADKLRIMVETGDRDGETFAVMVNNPGLPADGPQLDVRLYEADQVTTPDLWWNDPLAVDGIKFDAHGNPVEYHFLRAHPGDLIGSAMTYDRVPASAVFHWYDPDRPNQARGIPVTTPALPLYSQIRRFTLASLTSAEIGAAISGVMKSKLPPEYQPAGNQNAVTGQRPTFDRVDIEHGGLLTLPEGWDATAFDAKQPVAGYKEFKGEVLTEAGAGMNAPRNLSTKSSADYNYSSARLDHIPYRAEVAIIRDRLRRHILERLFRAWIKEAALIPGYLPEILPPATQFTLTWQWDGVPSIDPVKDATADDIGLKNGTKTLSDVLADRGKSWEEHLRQKAREITLARKLEKENGLEPGALYPLTPSTGAAPQPVEEPADAEPTAAA